MSDRSSKPLEITEGTKVGRYTLLTRIASGGMANVWLARVEGVGGFQKTVVVKTILPHLADDPEFVRMFIDEALLASRIDHPNVVSIFDLGETSGSYFIAMEYIAGRTLRHVQRELKRTRRVPPPWLVLRIIGSACDGLHHAHTMTDDNGEPMHIVHRDVSPENIMVTFMGDTKVLDFGIAKATNAGSKTRAGVLKGKYAYMAPEQIEGALSGGAPDPLIDVYSTGVVLYELLTGRRPFRAPNELALLRLILDTEPAPAHAVCNWVPEPLSALVMKAMARDRSVRFRSALELRDAIEEYFRATGSFPTRTHVANYLHGLFGDLASSPNVAQHPASVTPARRDSQQPDPWESTGDLESPLTIDLSMVLCSDEENPDSAPMSGLSPQGVVRPPEDFSLDAEPESASTPSDVDRGWTAPNHASTAPAETPPTWRPGPGEEPEADATESVPGTPSSNDGPSGMHTWDLLMQRARDQKRIEEEAAVVPDSEVEPQVEPPEPEESDMRNERDVHAWDRVVGRIRGNSIPAPDPPIRVEQPKRASDWFDEGLSCWRNKDFEGTLACWTKALELDPDNRRYESNLRKLKRQMGIADETR